MRILLTSIVALAMLMLAGCAKKELCPGEQGLTRQFTRIQTSQKQAKKKANPSMIYVAKSTSRNNGDPPVIFVTKSSNKDKRKPPPPPNAGSKPISKDKRKPK